MTPNLAKAYSKLNKGIENILDEKYGVLKVSFIIFVCFSLLYFPEIITKRLTNTWTGHDHAIQNFVNEKIQHPFKPYVHLEAWDHFRKRDLRLTPYVIGKIFHLEAIKLFYIQALLLFPLFIFLSLKTIFQLTKDYVIAFWGTIALLFTYAGNSFHYDTFFYDSYAYLGLLAAFYLRNHWSMIPILLITYFVDERSVVPSTIIFIANNLSLPNQEGNTTIGNQFLYETFRNKIFWKITATIIIYCLVRVILYVNYDLKTPVGLDSGIRLFVVLKHKFKVPAAIFAALKLNYILIFLAYYQLIKSKKWTLAISFMAIFFIIFMISTAVEDVTRSLAFGFPLILIYYQLLNQTGEEKNVNRLFIGFIAIVNSLLPTYTLLLHLYQVTAFNWIELLN
jgi:hypothetical protein